MSWNPCVKVTSRSRGRGSSILRSTSDAAGSRRHHEHPVGEEHRLAQVVGDEADGDLARRVQVADHAPQLFAREGVERAERLVEHQELRLMDQRAAERGALLHAARQFPRILFALAAQPDRGQEVLRARGILVRACAASRCGTARRSPAAAAGFPAWCATAAASAPGTPCRRSSPACSPAAPATFTVPLNGNCRPVASFIKVDLPQPEGPTTAANSPSSISSDSPSTAGALAAAAVSVADTFEGDERSHEIAPFARLDLRLSSPCGRRPTAGTTSRRRRRPWAWRS